MTRPFEVAASLWSTPGPDREAHLLMAEPARRVGAWTAFCDPVAVHVESAGWGEAVARVRDAGCRPVVALRPGTPLERVAALPADVGVLVMGVPPGRASSGFDPATPARLAALAPRQALGVDGGVDAERARRCRSRGATWVVSGSSLCSAPDPTAWLRQAGTGAPRATGSAA